MPDIQWDFPLADSTEGRILEAVKARLIGTELPSIDDERIVIKSFGWVPDESELPPPYIIVSPAPEQTPWQDGTNETDVSLFAVVITVVLANARETTRGLGLQLYWRERIRRKFAATSLLRMTELSLESGTFFTHGWVESGDKFLDPAKRDQRDVQYFVCRFKVKEPRE